MCCCRCLFWYRTDGTASSRLIVQSGIRDEFVNKMSEAMNNLVVGNALTPGAHIGAVVDQRQLEQNSTIWKLLSVVRNYCGSERFELDTEGYFMSPALFINTTNDMQINREEVFGPIACVIKVDSYEEALEVSNDSDFGLTSGIITTSLAHASHFKRHSKSGCVMSIRQPQALIIMCLLVVEKPPVMDLENRVNTPGTFIPSSRLTTVNPTKFIGNW